MIGINIDKAFTIKLFIMNLMSVQLQEILFYFLPNSSILFLLFYSIVNKQFNFFILLGKFLSFNQLLCIQEHHLRPNLIKYKLANISSK